MKLTAYVYRYVNLEKLEVCYIGKVTRDKDDKQDPLSNRHKQHKREPWYMEIGDENLLLQYIECSHTDADILETWLINLYGQTGQLINISKMNWGKSSIDLWPVFAGKWITYGRGYYRNQEEVRKMLIPLAENLFNQSEGLLINLDIALESFCDDVKSLSADMKKTYKITGYDAQDDFIRNKYQAES